MPACGWVIDKCGCGGCWDNLSPEDQLRAGELASNFVWAATGRRYGLCEVTLLPCNPRQGLPLYQTFPVADPAGWSPFGPGIAGPVLIDGQWSNRCAGGCRCRAVCEVDLEGPIADIIEVQVDGITVAPEAYEVHDRHLLVRTDGFCWPTCQVYGTVIPGFTVTFHRGDPIPAPLQYAAEILACEYAKICSGGTCRLPSRLASLSRQGVDVTIAEVSAEPGQLRTDIKLVDDAIAAANPYGRTQRPEVISPDLPPSRMITGYGNS